MKSNLGNATVAEFFFPSIGSLVTLLLCFYLRISKYKIGKKKRSKLRVVDIQKNKHFHLTILPKRLPLNGCTINGLLRKWMGIHHGNHSNLLCFTLRACPKNDNRTNRYYVTLKNPRHDLITSLATDRRQTRIPWISCSNNTLGISPAPKRNEPSEKSQPSPLNLLINVQFRLSGCKDFL